MSYFKRSASKIPLMFQFELQFDLNASQVEMSRVAQQFCIHNEDLNDTVKNWQVAPQPKITAFDDHLVAFFSVYGHSKIDIDHFRELSANTIFQ